MQGLKYWCCFLSIFLAVGRWPLLVDMEVNQGMKDERGFYILAVAAALPAVGQRPWAYKPSSCTASTDDILTNSHSPPACRMVREEMRPGCLLLAPSRYFPLSACGLSLVPTGYVPYPRFSPYFRTWLLPIPSTATYCYLHRCWFVTVHSHCYRPLNS